MNHDTHIVCCIKNNKMQCHPQYDIVSPDGSTIYGHVIRVAVTMPRSNPSNGSNRWDVMVYVSAEVDQVRFFTGQGEVVGRTCGEDSAFLPYVTETNEFGSEDIIPLAVSKVNGTYIDDEMTGAVKTRVEQDFGFVKDDEGNRKQIAIFPWQKCRW